MNCIVDMDIRRYADEQGDEVERDLAIEARAAELMAPGAEYDPLNARNFEAATTESMADLVGNMSQTIVALMADKNGPYIITRLLLAVATEYIKPAAIIEAETRIDERAEEFEEF